MSFISLILGYCCKIHSDPNIPNFSIQLNHAFLIYHNIKQKAMHLTNHSKGITSNYHLNETIDSSWPFISLIMSIFLSGNLFKIIDLSASP